MYNIDDLLINMQLYHAAMVFEAFYFPSIHASTFKTLLTKSIEISCNLKLSF